MSKYEDFDKLLDRCINNDNRKEMIESHMKLFAIDLYMNQSDRDKPSNITYKVDKASKYISMTKVYDFSNSFTDISCYSNPYFEFEFDRAEFYNFFKIYPKLKIYLEKLYGVDLYYIICSILNDYKLEISDKTFIFYEKYDKNKRKVLESILDV